ncbi:unnamed protein product [Coregonus sp. 'balchen']|nr:unnamed protein product [Coregonus sp. 'balchen']
MSWTHTTFLALVAVLLSLSLSQEVDSAAVPDDKGITKATDPRGPLREIFMPEADAANFFRRRSRRAAKSQDEIDEQDERTRESTEQWREFHYDGLHPPQEYNRQST